MGGIFGGKAAKKQAKAIKKASKLEAAADREAARGAQLAQETMLAQDAAARRAAELLSKPQGEVDVELESINPDGDDTFDPVTGKRKTRRQAFSSGPATTGVQI